MISMIYVFIIFSMEGVFKEIKFVGYCDNNVDDKTNMRDNCYYFEIRSECILSLTHCHKYLVMSDHCLNIFRVYHKGQG